MVAEAQTRERFSKLSWFSSVERRRRTDRAERLQLKLWMNHDGFCTSDATVNDADHDSVVFKILFMRSEIMNYRYEQKNWTIVPKHRVICTLRNGSNNCNKSFHLSHTTRDWHVELNTGRIQAPLVHLATRSYAVGNDRRARPGCDYFISCLFTHFPPFNF